MRRLLTTVLALAFVAAAGASHAQTVDLSWDNCTPIVTNKDTALPGGPLSFFASVLGQTTPHQAYQVWWLVGDANAQLPDAWRFDAAGCNGGFITYNDQPPTLMAKSCPPFVPAATQKVKIDAFQLAPPALGYATTAGNGSLSVSYPAGVLAPNPATPKLTASLMRWPPRVSTCTGCCDSSRRRRRTRPRGTDHTRRTRRPSG